LIEQVIWPLKQEVLLAEGSGNQQFLAHCTCKCIIQGFKRAWQNATIIVSDGPLKQEF